MIRAGIVGATGYAGEELIRLLLSREDVDVKWLFSKSYSGQKFSSIYRNVTKFIDMECSSANILDLADEVDIIFTATPQGYCGSIISDELLEKTKVIDLSADFRIKDVDTYEEWYGIKHKNPQFIDEAVYGLCEVNRERIANARLVANPGCFPTCSFLAIYPMVKEGLLDTDSIIIDAKSGTSGAGRGLNTANLFCEVNENCKAYKVACHRHTPEIEEQLSYAAGSSVVINFTPHLIPMQRGILATCYGKLAKNISDKDVAEVYRKYYEDEYFIRLMIDGTPPETRWVEGSNFVDISFKVDERTGRIIMMGAIDNLVKGAAGQAVQNMNIMFGIKENAGLMQIPMFP